MLFLLIFLLVLHSSVLADDFVFSGYTEVGRRSTSEDYEEEDGDNDYNYQNYHLKLIHKISDRLTCGASSFIYNKDYKSEDHLDNISRIYKASLSYYIRNFSKEYLRTDFKIKYKEKRYENSPESEYDQIRAEPSLTFKKKDFYTVNLSAGIDNFDYLEAGEKDQLKIFARIRGNIYPFEKKFRLVSSYKIERLKQKKIYRKRTKHDIMGGFDYVFNHPWVYKIKARAKWGQRDTKEEEERDEDYDYEYWRFYTKTEHRINPKLKTSLKYQYFEKDYISADLDHKGFYILSGLDYEIFNDKEQKFRLNLDVEHKDVDYIFKSDNNYCKETLMIKAGYKKKKNWKVSASLKGNFYDYNDPDNNKKRYYVKISGEKLFLEGDLVLSADLKYRYTDYDKKDNTGKESVRIDFKYKF